MKMGPNIWRLWENNEGTRKEKGYITDIKCQFAQEQGTFSSVMSDSLAVNMVIHHKMFINWVIL